MKNSNFQILWNYILNGNNFGDVLVSFGERRVKTKCDERGEGWQAVTAQKQE